MCICGFAYGLLGFSLVYCFTYIHKKLHDNDVISTRLPRTACVSESWRITFDQLFRTDFYDIKTKIELHINRRDCRDGKLWYCAQTFSSARPSVAVQAIQNRRVTKNCSSFIPATLFRKLLREHFSEFVTNYIFSESNRNTNGPAIIYDGITSGPNWYVKVKLFFPFFFNCNPVVFIGYWNCDRLVSLVLLKLFA